MNALSLAFRGLAVAGGLLAVVLALVIGNSKQRLEADLAAAVQRGDALGATLAEVEAARDALETRNGSLASDLDAERARANQAAQQLAQARRELQAQGADLTAARTLLEDRDRELNGAKRDLLDARTTLAGAPSADDLAARDEEIGRLRRELERARQEAVAARASGAADSSTGTTGTLGSTGSAAPTTASPIGTRGGAPAATASVRRVEGRVLAVTQDRSHVGIDLGADRGASPGLEVTVVQAGGATARLLLTEVRRDSSVGAVVASARGTRLLADATATFYVP